MRETAEAQPTSGALMHPFSTGAVVQNFLVARAPGSGDVSSPREADRERVEHPARQ